MNTDLLIARSLTWRYVIALILVAMLTTAAWVSLHLVISEQQSSAAVVNISGRQRMLSQRTALFSSLLVTASKENRPAIRSQLSAAAELMRKSHQGLTLGDAEMGLPAIMSDTVRSMYFEPPLALDGQVKTYLANLQGLLQALDDDLGPDNPLLQAIITASPSRLVASLDKMVSQYQREGEMAVARLHKMETIVWLVTLLLLAVEAAFIFRPFTLHVRIVIEKLHGLTEHLRQSQEELEERVLQRTADLAQKSKDLADSEEKFRLISTSAKDAILIIDQAEAITYWNPAATAIFGHPAEQALGRNLHDLLAPSRYRDDIHRGFTHFRQSGSGPMIGRTIEVMALRQDSAEFPIELSISALPLDGQVHALGIVRDISERKRMESELRELATTDHLTGLPNRRHFMSCFEEQLALIRRQVINGAAVLMMDIDHFKRVNDTFGHATGDALLRHIAELMREGLRKIDAVGRIGGEEFAFLLAGTDLAGAHVFAERLRQNIEATPLVHNEQTILATVSIGIAVMETTDSSPDGALVRADQALYRAKAGGRNQVCAAPAGAYSSDS